MRIGVRGHDFGRLPPLQLAQKLAACGADAVQLAIPKAIEGIDGYGSVSHEQLDGINAAFAANDIHIAVLGCYIDPAIWDERERKAQIGIFKNGIACARALGAEVIGTETTAFFGAEKQRGAAFDLLCESLNEMLDAAARQNVTVAVEPVAFHTLNTPELTAALLERFSGSGLSVIFDPVNLLTTKNIGGQSELWSRCLSCFGRAVTAIHMKDVFVGEDGGLIDTKIGDGAVDYAPIAAWFQENSPNVSLLREGIIIGEEADELARIRAIFSSCTL
ncbi:MAG: sugar phosphate isomerase/epimerase [Clostridium sp.]|jgi:sugar phosphate isomerase/epimerase|nr:sugar phosphate isomerase/epimerase [Clostridium sp.]